MLICNNCNAENEDGATRCNHCHMEGRFRQRLGENKSDDTAAQPGKVICRNCGSDAPGDAIRCVHCRFPLARIKTTTAIPRLPASPASRHHNGHQPAAVDSLKKP